MPLTQDEIAEVTESFNLIDIERKNRLTKDQLTSLFQDLKIKLNDQQRDVFIDGMLAYNQKGTLQNCINTISCIQDQDELGMLKICFRGIDKFCDRRLNVDQASLLSQVINKNMTKEELSGTLPPNQVKEFTFPMLAKTLLNITIPDTVDPYNGLSDKSSCCLLI